MPLALPPRALYLTEPISIEARRPLAFEPDLIEHLPKEITSLTGPVKSAWLPEQCFYLLVVLEAEHGTFVLKLGWGRHQSQELWAEHTIMRDLHGGDVPVPGSLALVQQGELCMQLREYVVGEAILAITDFDEQSRASAIYRMGEALSCIHAVRSTMSWAYDDWIGSSLSMAADNLAAGVLDPEEFTPDLPPESVLAWLHANRPGGDVALCLLHGDYRPKNILWRDGCIAGIIDWAYADIGDPYYDLSVINWYMSDDAEWRILLDGYGLSRIDQERLAYYIGLQKFLNV